MKNITGNTVDEIWNEIKKDFSEDEEIMEYEAVLQLNDRKVLLQIDIDPGGGFESGYESTSFTARIENSSDFRFSMHHEGYVDEIGKLFGMEDIQTGYPEFDKKVVVKTNNPDKIKAVFTSAELRKFFSSITDFKLGVSHHKEGSSKQPYLEFEMQKGITDPNELREIYNAFCTVLELLNTFKKTA